jgi:hypothetical protein
LVAFPVVPSLLADNVAHLCTLQAFSLQTGDCDQTASVASRLMPWTWLYRAFGLGPAPATSDELLEVRAPQLSFDPQRGQLFRVDAAQAGESLLFDTYVTLWFNAQVSAQVNLPAGLYELQVHAKHDRPGPVMLHLFADGKPVGRLSFARDDDSWETQCLVLHPAFWPRSGPESGSLTLVVRFVNDGPPPRGERDASIAWLRLVPLSLKTAPRG